MVFHLFDVMSAWFLLSLFAIFVIEMIAADEIETAYERMLKSDVKYRFVIDTASLGG